MGMSFLDNSMGYHKGLNKGLGDLKSYLSKTIDFRQINEYECLRENDMYGFAGSYLWRCYEESKTRDKIDVDIYTLLAELDFKLGTTASEQLFGILSTTTQLDIIKV